MKMFRIASLRMIAVALCAAAYSLAVSAQTAATLTTQGTTDLTVHITGARNATGVVRIALYRDGKGFITDHYAVSAAQIITIDAKTLAADAIFKNLPAGSYAAIVLHDENQSGQIEFNSQGLPTKGYGASNNPSQYSGPPTAEAALFMASAPTASIEIHLVYWQ